MRERRGRGDPPVRCAGWVVEHEAVIIYRSRYHRLLVNRPHQRGRAGDGTTEERDGDPPGTRTYGILYVPCKYRTALQHR